ncbi:uncharacterized protein LOC116346598 [Contarinia nasturtii]|uniref:uncharacterized protein LOC116346598 n=1 Tax=Contarinia nasturtii TaxID=265458 RepID=UPI0012D44F68|nr:uncharacterized protein LOC116346598 [Contarinia nasturtii]XP_031632603.1 uncharacterized protein LOC116346598 [Contarinia nasturtii]
MLKSSCIILVFLTVFLSGKIEAMKNKDSSKKTLLKNYIIDVVIPIGIKDKDKLENCVNGILRNSLNSINKVYIVAEHLSILESLSLDNKNNKKIVGISEKIYPFSKDDIKEVFIKNQADRKRSSWYYQQLLKFYIFDAIPNICDNVLILDSDFVFIKPIEFLNSEGKALLSYGYPLQYRNGTSTYFSQSMNLTKIIHAKSLIKDWDIINLFDGIHHHMLFNKDIMKSLFKNVEEHNKEPFWKAFINKSFIDEAIYVSEYLIYFHFAIKNFKNKVEARHLNTVDILYDSEDTLTLNLVHKLLDDFMKNKEPTITGIGCHGVLNLKDSIERSDSMDEELKKTLLQNEKTFYIFRLNEDGKVYVE